MAKTSATKQRRKSNRADYSSPAVDKAVDVIEFLASQRESVTTTEIAEGIGRSVGEIYRIVLALERRRLVRREESTERLRLSLRLFELAHRFPPVERLVQVARPEMDKLVRRSKQSCHLVVAEQREIVVVASQESPLPMRYAIRIGSRFDMFETSSGVVITAYSTEAQRASRLKGIKSERRNSLLARMDQVRLRGYEIRESDTVHGLFNISVPVHTFDGNILAALTVPYLDQIKATMEPEQIVRLQLEASKRMGRAVG